MSRYRDFIPAAAQLTGPIVAFATGDTYSPGDLVVNASGLYRSTATKAAGAPFNIADWERIDCGGSVVAYEAGHAYAAGALVVFNGNLYQANTATTAGAFMPAEWDAVVEYPIDNFSPTAPKYAKDQIVVYQGKLYRAKAALTSAKAFDPTDWDQIDAGAITVSPIQAFDATATYAIGDMVVQAGNIYTAKVAIGTPGAFKAVDWDKLGKSAVDLFDQTVPYLQNDLVVESGKIYRANAGIAAGSAFKASEWTEIDAGSVNLALTNFDPTTTYKKDDMVVQGGKIYRATASPPTVGPFAPTEWTELDIGGMPNVSITVFDQSKAYSLNDFVTQLGNIYKAKGPIAAGTAFDPTMWKQMDSDSIAQAIKPYSTAGRYLKDDLVSNAGNLYRANVIINTPGPFDPTKWQRIDAGVINQAITPYDSAATYAKDALVVDSGKIYRNVTAIAAPEPFTASKWVQIDLGALPKISWQVVSNDYTAKVRDGILADTTTRPITITLPPTPKLGDEVWFEDAASNFDTNAMTIARNGSNIMGLPQDMTVSTRYARFLLVFSDATHGWRLF